MSPALLSSQFALLEELGDDERGQSIDIACSIDHIVDAIVESVTPDCHNDSSS
jgi:gluconate kinase